MDKISKFCKTLEFQARRKAILYDGFNAKMTPKDALTNASEELGEIASAINRQRWNSVEDECIDLAHTAMLIYIAVRRMRKENGTLCE